MTAPAQAHSAFALPHSELNTFLYATICVEASGMALSVLSALARGGVDPWLEAGRLAQLPRAAAAAALSQRFAAIESPVWQTRNLAAVAAGVVALLPPRRAMAPLLPGLPHSRRLLAETGFAIGLAVLACTLALETASLTASGAAHAGGKPAGCTAGSTPGQIGGSATCHVASMR
jgi:hypothetical protein